ncbi:hypothetical protein J4Q44_G00347400 [Coregonus suidteri]|uniref:Uncharacterized protein n=1 Tax=Coregonus suidteri TaxID=861788 RepID=A0AAN8KUB1_9TELE
MKQQGTKDILKQYPAFPLSAIIFSEMRSKFGMDVDRNILSGFGTMVDKIIAKTERSGMAVELLNLYKMAP